MRDATPSRNGRLSGSGAPIEFHGLASLEETIAEADVIARVRLRSVTAVAESLAGDTDYTAALDFRFRVLEYERGSGGNELVGVVTVSGGDFGSSAGRHRSGQL